MQPVQVPDEKIRLMNELATIRNMVMDQFPEPHPFKMKWRDLVIESPFTISKMVKDFLRFFPTKQVNEQFNKELVDIITDQLRGRGIIPADVSQQVTIKPGMTRLGFFLDTTEIVWCEEQVDDNGNKRWRIVFLLGDSEKKIQTP